MILRILLLVSLVITCTACPIAPYAECNPGYQQSCTCASGGYGTQTCASDGYFGQCLGCSAIQPYEGYSYIPAGPTYEITLNASTVVEPGVQAGYGITANYGGAYRLVWTGDGAVTGSWESFWGSVYTPGTFSQIVPGCNYGACPLEQGDWVSNAINVSGGQRIDFDSAALDGLDGFDFVVDAEPVTFDLYINGIHYPDLVLFPAYANGGAISTVASIPFALMAPQ